MRIMIDPGHGGHDSGAVSPDGLRESEVNLVVGRMLAALFSANGDHVARMTRYVDSFVSLDERCDIANRDAADAFVSIHANSATAPQANGFEVWTSPGLTAADDLATRIFLALRAALPERRARVDLSDGDPDKEARFAVLVGTRMPAVLIELGFLSNPVESRLLGDLGFLSRSAEAIWSGVLDWIQLDRR